MKISAAVMGIEFAYAAETAFVSPTLLKIGVSQVQHCLHCAALHCAAQSHMTLIWCLSPLVGFLLTPVLGSLSDRCQSQLGRRRPFILTLSLGVVLGTVPRCPLYRVFTDTMQGCCWCLTGNCWASCWGTAARPSWTPPRGAACSRPTGTTVRT